jgi:hypothetical protein
MRHAVSRLASLRIAFQSLVSLRLVVGEVGSPKISLVEVYLVEFSPTEVRLYFWMLLSPLIPGVYSLLENSKVFLICHSIHLHQCEHALFRLHPPMKRNMPIAKSEGAF